MTTSDRLAAVTVDAFGTAVELVDPTVRLREALARHGVEAEEPTVARAFRAEVAFYLPRSHLGRDPASLAALRVECAGVFLGEAGPTSTPPRSRPTSRPRSSFARSRELPEALDRLREAGLALACVSNWDCSLGDFLAEAGLLDRFAVVVSSAEAGVPKPDPRPFLLALERLGVEPAAGRPRRRRGERPAGSRGRRAPVRAGPARYAPRSARPRDMTDDTRKGLATRLIHGGELREGPGDPLVEPIVLATTFSFETAQDFHRVMADEEYGFLYGSLRNPTVEELAAACAAVESAEAAEIFASGMAGIAAALFSSLEPGDTLLAPTQLYGNTYALVERHLRRAGVEVVYLDVTDLEAWQRPAKVRYVETLANPGFPLADLRALAETKGDGLLIVDNTFASPALCRPLELGADLVCESATKFLGRAPRRHGRGRRRVAGARRARRGATATRRAARSIPSPPSSSAAA